MKDKSNEDIRGWITLNRGMQSHWLWKEERKFSKAEAWLDLLMSANHKPKKVLVKHKLITCGRGETIQSLKTLSSRWGWPRETVRRFLKLCEKDEMICFKSEAVTSRITICNYDTYQSAENKVGRRRVAGGSHSHINNNVNNETIKEEAEGFVFFGIDLRTLDQKTLQGKQKTLEQLKQVAKLKSQGHEIN